MVITFTKSRSQEVKRTIEQRANERKGFEDGSIWSTPIYKTPIGVVYGYPKTYESTDARGGFWFISKNPKKDPDLHIERLDNGNYNVSIKHKGQWNTVSVSSQTDPTRASDIEKILAPWSTAINIAKEKAIPTLNEQLKHSAGQFLKKDEHGNCVYAKPMRPEDGSVSKDNCCLTIFDKTGTRISEIKSGSYLSDANYDENSSLVLVARTTTYDSTGLCIKGTRELTESDKALINEMDALIGKQALETAIQNQIQQAFNKRAQEQR